MLTHQQYVPVLRWKASERSALCKLVPDIRKRITPIFELVPLDFENSSTPAVLKKQVKQIAQYWGWSDLFFVDFCLLGESKAAHCLPIFAREAEARSLRVGLITGLRWPKGYQSTVKAALKKASRELCFRISAYELRQAGVQEALNDLLVLFEKEPADVHLVIDFQSINDPLPDIGAYVNSVPNLDEWRSFTAIAGAFPKDLANIEKHSQHEQPRNDWLIWKYFASSTKSRIPSFGDYTIRHGIFEENEGKGLNPSASIRYTASDYWVIMRGEGVKNEGGAGFSQFPAQAELLRCRDDFCGAQFSYGDSYIFTMAQQFNKSGHLKDWLVAGFNHHLTFVVRQLDDFFAAARSSAPLREGNPNQHTLQA